MLKKQTLDKNILTGKPQMCMLTIIIPKLSIHGPIFLGIPIQFLIKTGTRSLKIAEPSYGAQLGHRLHYPCRLSIHRIASTSLIFPKYL